LEVTVIWFLFPTLLRLYPQDQRLRSLCRIPNERKGAYDAKLLQLNNEAENLI
jgi:hypothetical protein